MIPMGYFFGEDFTFEGVRRAGHGIKSLAHFRHYETLIRQMVDENLGLPGIKGNLFDLIFLRILEDLLLDKVVVDGRTWRGEDKTLLYP